MTMSLEKSAEMFDRLRQVGLDSKDVQHHSILRRASVMVILFLSQNEPYVLLTKRPMHLKSHPGEVCFPGGKQDELDGGDDVRTALRETEEEVGLQPSLLEILCRLRTVESIHHLCVTPIVGFLLDSRRILSPDSLSINRTEVDAVFYAPLRVFRERPLEEFAVEWSRETFIFRHFRYEDVRCKETFSITGLTAHVAHQVAEIVFGGPAPTANLFTATSSKGAPLTQTQSNRSSGLHSGQVWIRQQSSTGRSYWSRRFMVYDHGSRILHQYDNQAQAERKRHSANKKNRLVLHKSEDPSCQVMALSSGLSTASAVDKYEFVVSALDGRVKWHLATATKHEFDMWMCVIGQT